MSIFETYCDLKHCNMKGRHSVSAYVLYSSATVVSCSNESFLFGSFLPPKKRNNKERMGAKLAILNWMKRSRLDSTPLYVVSDNRLAYHFAALHSRNIQSTLWSWIQVTGLLIKTHWIFLEILLFQPGLWIKSLPCLQFQPGLKPSLVTSKQKWCHCHINREMVCSVFQPGFW